MRRTPGAVAACLIGCSSVGARQVMFSNSTERRPPSFNFWRDEAGGTQPTDLCRERRIGPTEKEVKSEKKEKKEKESGSAEAKEEENLQTIGSNNGDFKPGQKYACPAPANGDRVFYETLLKQTPGSEMAQDW